MKKLKFIIYALIVSIVIAFISYFAVIGFRKLFVHYNSHPLIIDVNDSYDNLNTSYTINDNGDLVGNNLFNINDLSFVGEKINDYTFKYHGSEVLTSINWKSNTQYTFSGYCKNEPSSTSFDRLRIFYTDNTQDRITSNYTDDYIYFSYTSSPNKTILSLNGDYSNNGGYGYIEYLMINEGTTVLPWEPYGVWYSENNYNDVVNDYNNLNNDVIKFNNYGMLSYLSYMEVYIGDNNYYFNENEDTEMNFDYCVSQGFIQSGGLLNLTFFTGSSVNPNYYTISASLYFESDKIYVSQFNLNFDSSVVASVDVDFYGFSYNTPIPTNLNSYSILSSDLLDLANDNQSNSSLSGVDINFNSADSVGLVNFNSVSAVSFNNGYQKGYSARSNSINNTYAPQINELRSTIVDLESELTTLTDNYNALNVAYQNLVATSEDDLDTLAFTMVSALLSTPVNILHDYLNFNFFGINVFGIFTSLITILLLVWLIKFFLGRK